jgi:hypothetical protein
MIIAIKAIVNRQIIIDSIEQVKSETEKTKEQTAHINNFLTPYFKSNFAPYFFAHENNQIFPGEKIIKIINIDKSIETQTNTTGSWSFSLTWWKTSASQRNIYLKQLIQHIDIWYNNIPFFK